MSVKKRSIPTKGETGPKFQPGIYVGKVISTSDLDIFIDFGRTGLIHLERDGKPTKYAKGQIVHARIAIVSEPQNPNSTV